MSCSQQETYLLRPLVFSQSPLKVDVQSADGEGGKDKKKPHPCVCFPGIVFLFSQAHSMWGLCSVNGKPVTGPWALPWLPPARFSRTVPGISSQPCASARMSHDQAHPVLNLGRTYRIAIPQVRDVVPEADLWLLSQSRPCRYILMNKCMNSFKNTS